MMISWMIFWIVCDVYRKKMSCYCCCCQSCYCYHCWMMMMSLRSRICVSSFVWTMKNDVDVEMMIFCCASARQYQCRRGCVCFVFDHRSYLWKLAPSCHHHHSLSEYHCQSPPRPPLYVSPSLDLVALRRFRRCGRCGYFSACDLYRSMIWHRADDHGVLRLVRDCGGKMPMEMLMMRAFCCEDEGKVRGCW